MPSAWGHTRLLETDWRFITQESHCFSCGSVKGHRIQGLAVLGIMILGMGLLLGGLYLYNAAQR